MGRSTTTHQRSRPGPVAAIGGAVLVGVLGVVFAAAVAEAAAGLKNTQKRAANEATATDAVESGTAPDAPNPYLGDAAMIAEGKRLYAGKCYLCHRKTGGRGPNLREMELSDAAFMSTVMKGRRGNRGTMPAWRKRLTPDDVWKIHAYVKDGVKQGVGDYVDRRAEMDVLAVLSNCPERGNPAAGFEPTPVRAFVYTPG